MSNLTYESIEVGAELPSLELPPVTRTTLALFAGASGDHNPIHIDIDFAKKAGMPDVFAQGMLPMAYLGRLLSNWAPQQAIRSFGVRFGAMTQLSDRLTCSGKVVEKREQGGERMARLEIRVADQKGEVKLQGEALVALP